MQAAVDKLRSTSNLRSHICPNLTLIVVMKMHTAFSMRPCVCHRVQVALLHAAQSPYWICLHPASHAGSKRRALSVACWRDAPPYRLATSGPQHSSQAGVSQRFSMPLFAVTAGPVLGARDTERRAAAAPQAASVDVRHRRRPLRAGGGCAAHPAHPHQLVRLPARAQTVVMTWTL